MQQKLRIHKSLPKPFRVVLHDETTALEEEQEIVPCELVLIPWWVVFCEIPVGRDLEVWDGHLAVVGVGRIGVENRMDRAARDQRGRLEAVHGAPKQTGRQGDVALQGRGGWGIET